MRLWLIAAAAALVGLGMPAFAQSAPSQEAMRELADRFDRAQLGKDLETLEAMVAEDLVFVGSDGRRQGRSEFIAGWMDPQVTFEPVTITDRYFLPLAPDVAVVGGEAVLRGTAGGQAFSSRIRFSDTFRRIAGEWKAVHIQATRVPEARPQE
ncbi:nuclear transport factor 2 family protein [Sphingosinicella sp. CPCC 101087]|uniref:nuclear transport factor 2 family protein n=1 Tax=Sphingosinicella sp. CPCC 101087 TaxID=2497754 RepID=UPI00101D37DF|nr:nuclear transport factor 2 family protein [Sphingosinicella sp. CPCC 101087]